MQRYEVNWDDDAQILSFTKERWDNKDYYKRGLESKWLDIIAAYEGLPYYNWDHFQRRLVEHHKVPSWRVQLVVNLFLPYIRTAASKHLRNRPIWDVLPEAADDLTDLTIANNGKKLLRSYWFKNNVNYKFIDLLLWLGLTGNGFIYTYWNPDEGPLLELHPKDFITPNLIKNIQSEQQLQELLQQAQQAFEQFIQQNTTNKINIGEAELEIVSPFDVVFPYTTDFYKKSWFIRGQVRDRSHYADMGFDPSQFQRPSPKDSRFTFYAKRVHSLFNFGSTEADTGTDPDDEVLELQLWIPRVPRHPQLAEGRFIVIAGGKIIHNSSNPYKHQQIPYVHFGTEKVPGKVWHMSSIEHVSPIIKEYQKTQSQIIEVKNMMGKPKWLVSRLANVKNITSAPGEIVYYTGNMKPDAWHPPSVPRYMFELLLMNRQDADDIMAQRDATKGKNPPGGRSAIMLENLQSQDEGQLAIAGLNLDTGFSYLGSLVLSLYDQFIQEDRVYTYVGERNRLETVKLKSGVLQRQDKRTVGSNFFRVRVTQFSQFGLSRAGQLEFLKLLLQFNVFTPADRSKILHFIDMGYFGDDIDEFKADRANAHQENLLMTQGIPAQINPADHHKTHREEHEVFMKSDDYKLLPPELKNLFIFHLQETKLFEVMQMVEPQVLAVKAQIFAAQLNQIPPELIINARRNGQTRDSEQERTGESTARDTE